MPSLDLVGFGDLTRSYEHDIVDRWTQTRICVFNAPRRSPDKRWSCGGIQPTSHTPPPPALLCLAYQFTGRIEMR